MFKLRRPCKTCPFSQSAGRGFGLSAQRIHEIVEAPAFQCHKTVHYSAFDDAEARQGDHPPQCAGLIATLHQEGRPNQITQVAMRLIGFDPAQIDQSDTFPTIAAAIAAHRP